MSQTIFKYTQAKQEQAIIKMYQGLTAGNKNKIIAARKFPKNAMDSFDLFKTYFLSGEGLPMLIKKLSEREIVVLHILAFNQWITDVSVFEAAYIEMPKPSKYSYSYRRQTFTQRYGPLLKAVQKNLFQKGLLVKYEDPLSGKSTAERQRFMFPPVFADYLPNPFSNLQELSGTGVSNEEAIRKEIKQAIQSSPKPSLSGLALVNKKLVLKRKFLNAAGLAQIKFRHWSLANGALILFSQYFNEGEPLSDFVFHYLQQLSSEQWFSEKSLESLLSVWDDPKKRQAIDNNSKVHSKYDTKKWCEAGWKAGLLEKQSKAGIDYYRLAKEDTASIDFKKHLTVKEDGRVQVNLTTVPLSILVILNQVAFFETANSLKPDLVNISSFPIETWTHPLIAWLKENASAFKIAFEQFKKKYGKEIIHNNLLVAKITDLSLRVLVEKGLGPKEQIVLLSDEFIAFPKSALPIVERIIAKSGNVIKRIG